MDSKKTSHIPPHKPNRQGRPAPGWVQQSIQIPEAMREEFRAEAGRIPGHGVKMLGTLAVGLYLGLPDEIQRRMYHWLNDRLYKDGGEPKLTARQVLEAFVAISEEIDSQSVQTGEHVLTRILDPELTPEPGKKASDRKGRDAI